MPVRSTQTRMCRVNRQGAAALPPGLRRSRRTVLDRAAPIRWEVEIKVPFARPDVGLAEAEAVSAVILSGDLASGKTCTRFEERFAARFGAAHAVSVGSCTQGFLLLLSSLGVCGQTVLSPTYTFTGPAAMAAQVGATVALLDNAPGSYAPGLADWASAGMGAKVAMPVHFAGRGLDLRALRQVLPADCVILDDAAHALSTLVNGECVGNSGALATVFSFYATKNLCTGNGGMILTEDADLARELRKIRLHGFSRDLRERYSGGLSWDYSIEKIGWKCNLTDVAAAMGLVQLDRLAAMQGRRERLARIYSDGLADVPGITCPGMDEGPGSTNAWHLYPISLSPPLVRNDLHQYLRTREIDTSVHFIPLHQHPAWAGRGPFPHADRAFQGELSLPMFSAMTDDQARYVVGCIRDYVER